MIDPNNPETHKTQLLQALSSKQQSSIEQLILEKVTLENSNTKKSLEKAKKIDQKLKKLKVFQKIEKSFDNLGSSTPFPEFPESTDSDQVQIGFLKLPQDHWNKLLPHQQSAMHWLYSRYESKTGGILGDEMGLGKTVMVSVFLNSLYNSCLITGGVLIVSPATLLPQWSSELQKWAPSLHINLFKPGQASSAFLKPGTVTLITYEILHTQSKTLQRPLWFYVILDEGHKIKNSSAQITLLCKAFNTYNRLLLSGTPIQNSLNELWSLFDFVHPGLLGTEAVFAQQFGDKITKAGYCRSSELEVEVAYECAVQLRKIIEPFFLRRTKREIDIGIPEHEEKILFCDLEEKQWEVYCKYIVEIVDRKVLDVKVCIKDLRLICNHPQILRNDVKDRIGISEDYLVSGKIRILNKIVQDWQDGQFLVIFSQFKKMIGIVMQVFLDAGIRCARVDGDLNVEDRVREIRNFNEGFTQVLILTTKVGGLGINLPRATQVILLDPDWNPMNDNQAKERALRIGQKNKLSIYRFITRGTIEEKIYNKQLLKLLVAEKILINPEQKRFFATQDIHNLFKIPPKPESLINSNEANEIILDIRKRKNEFIEYVLGCEAKDITIGSALNDSNFSNFAELSRIKSHAQQLAGMAVQSLKRSNEFTPVRLNVSSGPIGTGKVRNFLLNKPLVTVLNKPKRTEETMIEILHKRFKENNMVLETDDVIETFNKDMKGFDKFLLRDILKQISKKDKNGVWVLRSEFRNI